MVLAVEETRRQRPRCQIDWSTVSLDCATAMGEITHGNGISASSSAHGLGEAGAAAAGRSAARGHSWPGGKEITRALRANLPHGIAEDAHVDDVLTDTQL